jgi:outer membrane protein TolC
MNKKSVIKNFLVSIFFILLTQNCYSVSQKTNTCPITPKIKRSLNTKLRLTLPGAIRLGIKQRPSLKALQFATTSQQKEADKQLSSYLPQLTVSGPTLYTFPTRKLDSISISISQLLYSPAGPGDLYRISMKSVKISQYAQALHEDLIQHQVEHAFLKCWLLEEKRYFITTLKVASDELYSKATHKDLAGLLNKQEKLRADTSNIAADAKVITYFNQLFPARGRLEYFIGEKLFCRELSKMPLHWRLKENPIKLDTLDNYCQKSYENRKEIKSKNVEIRQAELYKKYYAKKHYPSFNAGSSLDNNDQSLYFKMTWNIFDGLSSRFSYDSFKAKKMKIQMEKSDLIQKINLEVETEFYHLKILLKDLEAKAVALKAAKNLLVLSKEKFKVGLNTKVAVKIANENWEKSHFEWLEYCIACQLKKSDLDFACGYPKN